jgi:hypothetical protein
MKPWRCDPYLWVHLAGLATVPLWIDLCLLGLAVGSPSLPGLELGFMGAVGVLPVLAVQLWRPFYIFSLPGLALRPRALHDDQRRLLTQFRRWRVRLGALVVPILLVWALVTLYPLAFLARDMTPFGDWGRLGGVAIAALGFLMANLFLQVPVAVLQVLATPDRRFQNVVPYPADRVAADFSWLGLPVGQILPAIAPPTSALQGSLEVQVAPRHTEDAIPTAIDSPVEAKDPRVIADHLPDLETTSDLGKASQTEASPPSNDPGEDFAALDDHSHEPRESRVVALEEPESEPASITMAASTTDSDSLPDYAAQGLAEEMPQPPDRSDFLPRQHPEVDDLDGDSLARDHASGNQPLGEDSLPPLASQPSMAEQSRMPENSTASLSAKTG